MDKIDVLFRKKNLHQLKAIVGKAPLPLVSLWRLEEDSAGVEATETGHKLEKMRLDRSEVFKTAVCCDEVASTEIVQYISARK